MNEFSFVRALASGLGFFAGRTASHAMILVGIGALMPVVLQMLLFWRMMVMASLDGPVADAAAGSSAGLFVTAAGFALQTISFFASWRLGLARGVTLRGALAFGLIAGLMMSVGFALALVAVGTAAGMITGPVAAAAVLFAFVALFGLAWSAYAGLFAATVSLAFVLALAFGAAVGNMTYAATIVGGSGFVWTLLIAASLVLLWLAARLSCTTLLMAERKSFNLWAAMRESWSLTWDDEWRITRYLGLVGLVMALWVVGVTALSRAALASTLTGGSQSAIAIAAGIVLLLLSVPFAYLSVLVPAGIYRELARNDTAAAEIFA